MTQIKTRHFLQSDEWAKFQKVLGNTVIERSGDGWQYHAILERGDGKIGRQFKRLYTPYGPSYTNEAALEAALQDLEKQAKKHDVDYVRVEPLCLDPTDQVATTNGYKRLAHSFQPSLTLIIDINRPFADVLADMSKTNRYLWNRRARNNLRFRISYETEDLEAFLMMMNETSQRTRASFRREQYYELLLESLGPTKNIGVAYAYHEDEVLVGVLFADDFVAKTRYYLYAGSFDKARKFSANAPLVVYLLHEAQNSGIKNFDFFGVAPASATDHRWAGFSKFKRSFGGTERAFAGTWEKPIKKGRYAFMNFARKFAR